MFRGTMEVSLVNGTTLRQDGGRKPASSLRARLLLDFGPGILERERPIEYFPGFGRLRIETEVADTLELEAVFELGACKRRLKLRACQNFETNRG